MPAAVAHDWPMHHFAVALDCDAKPGGEACQLQHAPDSRDSPQRARHERLVCERAIHGHSRSSHIPTLLERCFCSSSSLRQGDSACQSLSCCNLIQRRGHLHSHAAALQSHPVSYALGVLFCSSGTQAKCHRWMLGAFCTHQHRPHACHRRPMFKHNQWRIYPDDVVQVITGPEKGITGKVLAVIKDKKQPEVIVEGINMVRSLGTALRWRVHHQKASATA